MLVERGAVKVDLSCLMHCTIHRYSKLPSSHKMRFLSRELSQDEFFVSRNETRFSYCQTRHYLSRESFKNL